MLYLFYPLQPVNDFCANSVLGTHQLNFPNVLHGQLDNLQVSRQAVRVSNAGGVGISAIVHIEPETH
jgi:hypothetical protein